MKNSLLALFITSLFFTACSTNSALENFNNLNLNANSLQYTKKVDIVLKKEPKIQIFATYLNPLKIDKKEENFLIGIYFVNKKEENFKNSKALLTLNNKQFVKISHKVSSKSIIVKSLSIKNPWAKYYIFSFPKQDDNNLILKFNFPNIGNAQLNFEK